VVTPSGILYKLPELEQRNHLMREFKEQEEFFLRVNFFDDTLEFPKKMLLVTKNYFREVLDGFTILDRKYKYLGWSASQLRSSGCWFYCE
jgi:hypothetical protein